MIIASGPKLERAIARTTMPVILHEFNKPARHHKILATEAIALIRSRPFNCRIKCRVVKEIFPLTPEDRTGTGQSYPARSSWDSLGNAKCLQTYDSERRQRELDALGSHTPHEWQAIVDKFGRKCLRCNVSGEDVTLTKDHVTPLIMGGTNFASNLQPLCGSCNSWKGNREIDFRTLRAVA